MKFDEILLLFNKIFRQQIGDLFGHLKVKKSKYLYFQFRKMLETFLLELKRTSPKRKSDHDFGSQPIFIFEKNV